MFPIEGRCSAPSVLEGKHANISMPGIHAALRNFGRFRGRKSSHWVMSDRAGQAGGPAMSAMPR
jgi:hypothetical protein